MDKIKIQNNQEEDKLYNNAIYIIDNGRNKIIEALYNESTKSYYMLGKLIVDDEQNGKLKAEYGKKLLRTYQKDLL